MGLLQIDFVNIVTPSHYLVLWTRLGAYDRALLDRVTYHPERQFTEHWAHEASIVPMDMWPLLAYRRATYRIRPYGFEKYLTKRVLRQLVDAVSAQGPLRPDEMPRIKTAPGQLDGTWYTSMERIAAEALFGRGDFAIATREQDFSRRYDLTSRIVPPHLLAQDLEVEEQHRQLLLMAAKASGVATAADLADYFRLPVTAVRPRIAELAASGKLEPVQVEGWKETAYRIPGEVAPPANPRQMLQTRLLSPFDPVVWFRQRTERLFGFEYRLETFVPAEKRRWGCFCLPVLHGDELVARVDVKAERKEGVLAVLATFPEDAHTGNDAIFCESLPAELNALAQWLGLERAVTRHPHRNRALRGTLASSRASRAAGRARP